MSSTTPFKASAADKKAAINAVHSLNPQEISQMPVVSQAAPTGFVAPNDLDTDKRDRNSESMDDTAVLKKQTLDHMARIEIDLEMDGK